MKTTNVKPLPGDWARDIAAQYRAYAESTEYEPRRIANFAEAAKYEAIGARMDGAA